MGWGGRWPGGGPGGGPTPTGATPGRTGIAFIFVFICRCSYYVEVWKEN